MAGQLRVLKSAREARWGIKIKARDAVVPWLMEYAAHLLNRFEVGHDGKTSFSHPRGRTCDEGLCAFSKRMYRKILKRVTGPGLKR